MKRSQKFPDEQNMQWNGETRNESYVLEEQELENGNLN